MTARERCDHIACAYGLTARCIKPAGHTGNHVLQYPRFTQPAPATNA